MMNDLSMFGIGYDVGEITLDSHGRKAKQFMENPDAFSSSEALDLFSDLFEDVDPPEVREFFQ